MKNTLKKIITAIITLEAKFILKKYKPKIIAVTGSVGKTSTKDAIYTVLSHFFFVRKSEKSFNSDIGVPLTILGSENAWSNPFLWIKNIVSGAMYVIFKMRYPKYLVLEVGADRPGDIEKIAQWLKPNVAVVTRFAQLPVHVEFFASPKAVVEEKGHLVKNLKTDGLLVLNGDDDDVMSLRELFRGSNVKTYGITNLSEVSASNERVLYGERNGKMVPEGVTFKVDFKGCSLPVSIKGSLGRQHVYPALAAITVGLGEDLPPVAMAEALSLHESPNGRMKVIEGEKDSTIIDDTYNSSPIAAAEALEVLKSLALLGRKIAVLGDMMELGKYSVPAHKDLGKGAAKIVDMLVTVGIRARDIAEGALSAGMDEKNILQFDSTKEASDFVEPMIKEGDILLVKGSQSVRLERFVEAIMYHPEDKEKLLVRQEKEWQKR